MPKISLTQPASEADLAARELNRCTVCGDTAGWCIQRNNHARDYRPDPWPPVRDEPDDSYYDAPEGWEP